MTSKQQDICVGLFLLASLQYVMLMDTLEEPSPDWDAGDLDVFRKIEYIPNKQQSCSRGSKGCSKPSRIFEDTIFQPKSLNFKSLLADFPVSEKRGKSPLFHLSHLLACSCGMNYHIRDLGRNYFPRYIPTAVCQSEACWGGSYKCRPKHYQVRVLRMKNLDDAETEGSSLITLPPNLRDEWAAETIMVTVGCQCGP